MLGNTRSFLSQTLCWYFLKCFTFGNFKGFREISAKPPRKEVEGIRKSSDLTDSNSYLTLISYQVIHLNHLILDPNLYLLLTAQTLAKEIGSFCQPFYRDFHHTKYKIIPGTHHCKHYKINHSKFTNDINNNLVTLTLQDCKTIYPSKMFPKLFSFFLSHFGEYFIE